MVLNVIPRVTRQTLVNPVLTAAREISFSFCGMIYTTGYPSLGTIVSNLLEESPMNKNELIAEVVDRCEITKAKAAEALDAFIETISKSLTKGKEVRLVGFGTFTTVKRKATEGRNPRTGDVIKIAASTQPKFKPGKALKDQVNKRKAA